jgi:hypothetical protein
MKKHLIGLLIFLANISYAQDQLFKKDNTKLEVKILEISQNEIKYKLFTYQDGPTIIISKSDVALIIYQNGVHEVLNTPAVPESPAVVYYQNSEYSGTRSRAKNDSTEFAKLTMTKNLISTNILDPLNGSFSLSYLREFAHNYLNVYVPVSFGFANPYFTQTTNSLFNGNFNSYYYTTNNGFYVSNFKYNAKTFDVGLGLHFQTSGKHVVTHFVGPYVGIAQFTGSYTQNNYYNDPNYGYSNYEVTERSFVMNRLYVMLDNGLLFRITKNFNIIMLVGAGYHVDTYLDNNLTKAMNSTKNQFPINAYKFGLSFGYRF